MARASPVFFPRGTDNRLVLSFDNDLLSDGLVCVRTGPSNRPMPPMQTFLGALMAV